MNTKTILITILVAVLLVLAAVVLTAPDDRTVGEKVSDAVESVSEGEGLEQGAEELEDRSAAERIGDSVTDFGETAADNVNDAVNDAVDSVNEAADDAARNVEEAVDDAEAEIENNNNQ